MTLPTWLLGIVAAAGVSLGTWVVVAIQDLRTDIAVTKTDVRYIREMIDQVQRRAEPRTTQAADRDAMLGLLLDTKR